MLSHSFISLINENLFSPVVLFFCLGVFMGMMKSDLDIPKSVERFLAIYLIIAIGFKGGVSLRGIELNQVIILTSITSILLGFLIPVAGFMVLRKTTRLNAIDAAAVAAHYGSISIVTFLTATSFLKNEGIVYQGFIVGVLAIMEVPAIIVALLFARHYSATHKVSMLESLRELLSNGSIILLIGSILIGSVISVSDYDKLKGFFVDPFYGLLSIFLLTVGSKIGSESNKLRILDKSLISFAIYMPVMCGVVGVMIAYLIGLDKGTSTLFGVLMASASYIAVPATLKIALPEANPSVYMPMSLGITFPFNIIFGIPIYYYTANILWG